MFWETGIKAQVKDTDYSDCDIACDCECDCDCEYKPEVPSQ